MTPEFTDADLEAIFGDDAIVITDADIVTDEELDELFA